MDTAILDVVEKPEIFEGYTTIEHEGRHYVDIETARHIIKKGITEIYRENGKLTLSIPYIS